MSPVAATLMLTTKCSAGCGHCPFAQPGLPALHLSPAQVRGFFHATRAPLVVLSGGEPFEHPQLAELLAGLAHESVPFRIATGGHVDLKEWLAPLAQLARANPAFRGISLGTDVLSSRSPNAALRLAWRRNWAALRAAKIPFSLTVTLNEDLDDSFSRTIAEVVAAEGPPDFTYLRHPAGWEERAALWGATLGTLVLGAV